MTLSFVRSVDVFLSNQRKIMTTNVTRPSTSIPQRARPSDPQSDDASTKFMDKNDAANFLGIPVQSVLYLAAKGRLPSYKPANKVLFRLDDLEAHRDANFRPSVPLPDGSHPKGWRRCGADRRDHHPCGAPAMRGKTFCLFHDPDRPLPPLPRPAPQPVGRPRRARVEPPAPASAPDSEEAVR